MSTPETQHPPVHGCKVTYPAPFVMLVTITREKQMNSIGNALHWQLHHLFRWFDEEPNLRVAVITGSGKKAFCAGQDLIELGKSGGSGKGGGGAPALGHFPSTGFAGISRRLGKKPIIAAVNGFALGGGFEITLNCDMVVASPNARFGLPEALRGIYAAAGGLPRLVRNCGMHVASEIAMTGRQLSAQEAHHYGLVNKVSQSQETIIDEAVEMASKVASISPDAIIVTRAALRETWETASVERAFTLVDDRLKEKLFGGENTMEGLMAFAEKRAPKWVPSKL